MLLCLAFVVGFGVFCGEGKTVIYSPDWPGTYFIGQARLELIDLCMGLEAWATISGQIKHLKIFILKPFFNVHVNLTTYHRWKLLCIFLGYMRLSVPVYVLWKSVCLTVGHVTPGIAVRTPSSVAFLPYLFLRHGLSMNLELSFGKAGCPVSPGDPRAHTPSWPIPAQRNSWSCRI